MKQQAGRGSTAKHAGTGKHGGTSKHAPKQQAYTPRQQRQFARYVARHPNQAKARGAQAGLLAVCPPPEDGRRQAPGASLDGWAACTAIALGASLRLAGWPVADEDILALHAASGGTRDAGVPILVSLRAAAVLGFAGVRPRWAVATGEIPPGSVLGLQLPGGAHTVCASGGAWLSWGRSHAPSDFPGAVVEEAWVVTWP